MIPFALEDPFVLDDSTLSWIITLVLDNSILFWTNPFGSGRFNFVLDDSILYWMSTFVLDDSILFWTIPCCPGRFHVVLDDSICHT